MSESLKEETKRGMAWGFVERFSLQIIQFIIGIILARLLSPSDYGLIGMLSVFIAISQTLIDSGFSNALIQKKDRTEIDYSTVFYFNTVLGIIFYIISFISAPYIATFFNEPLLNPLFKLIAITLFLNSLLVVQKAILTIKIDFRTQAIISCVASLISGIIGIILAYNNYGVWALAWQSVINAVIQTAMYWTMAKWLPIRTFSIASFKSLFSYGSKIMASGLLHTFYLKISSLLLGKFYSSSALGFYTRAEQLASLPLNNVTLVFQRTTFPILSKIQDDDERLMNVYGKYLKGSSFVLFLIIFLMVAQARPLVLFLLGTKWETSILPFQLLCIAFMFDHLFSVNLNLLQVKGRSDLFLRLEIIKKAISITLMLFGLYFNGVIGLCVAKIIYSQIALVINTYYTGKLFNYPYKKQVKDFAPYLIFAVIINLPVFIMAVYIDSYLLVLIIGTLFSISCYIFILYKMKDEYATRCVEYLKNNSYRI